MAKSFVVEFHGLGMTIPSTVAIDIYLNVDWFAVLCAEMVDDVTDTQVLYLPGQESDNGGGASVRDYTTLGLICRAVVHLEVRILTAQLWQRYSHPRFLITKETRTHSFFQAILSICNKHSASKF